MREFILRFVAFAGIVVLSGCISTDYQPISLVENGTLTFPDEAKSEGITYGVVVLEYDVLVDGTVANAEVVSADPPGYFEKEALRFIGTWRFRPAHRNGEPIELQDVESSIEFNWATSDEYSTEEPP